jgi:hypothetical protein
VKNWKMAFKAPQNRVLMKYSTMEMIIVNSHCQKNYVVIMSNDTVWISAFQIPDSDADWSREDTVLN